MSGPPPVVEYEGAEFPGVIGRTLDESEPMWPAPRRAPAATPNVVVVLWDDVGFGQFSAFGGLCETPTLDRLAARGLRYTNFHTTALCTPTRGSLLSGRNHHSLGLSAITEASLGFPAHNCFVGHEHGFLSEMLLPHGFNTFAVGKWHLTAPTESTAAGPFDRWPLGRGFERFYGFLAGSTDQWHPDLTCDNHAVGAPSTPEEGYHLNADLADQAIRFIKDAHIHAPDKPFLLYYAPGAGHSPHQVEPEWIERYRGRFDAGWDAYREEVFQRQQAQGIIAPDAVLGPRDPDVPAWEDLGADARRVLARQMEVFAGFLEQTDHHLGRVIDFIAELDELDNTIVIVLSDNGASAEGGEHGTFNEALFFNAVPETLSDNLAHFDEWGGENTYAHYSWGWASAGNTPFRRWKRETYRGGITDPCIVSWPAGIAARGDVRHQYAHVTDVVPTVLEVLGIEAPAAIGGVAQSPIHGVSFAHTFASPDAPTRHSTQYFEMFASRSIYHEGWKANCPFPGPSFAEAAEHGRFFGMNLSADLLDELDRDGWELYHVAADPTEAVNLATVEPERLREMVDRWYEEAERYGVFPLAAAGATRLLTPRPMISVSRDRQTWYPDASPVYFGAAPKIANRPYRITADVTIPAAGAEGVIVCHGSRHGGYALYLQGGRLHHVYNFLALERYVVSSTESLGAGDHTVGYEFVPTAPGFGPPGRGLLTIDGDLVGAVELARTAPNRVGPTGFSCGYAAFDTVAPDLFAMPFRFTGTLHRVVVDLSGDGATPDDAAIRELMTRQ